jgi:NAD(P)-dependent dehydrogenase (short-subunit alcohol dehydrogenase family)
VGDLVVVGGASGGLGPALVAAFLARGDRVVGVGGPGQDVVALTAARPGVEWHAADLTRHEAVEALWRRIDEAGPPRWVVNLAGGFRGGRLVDSSPEDYERMLALNLDATWWSCRAAAARLAAGGGGAIVNVASRSALVTEGGAAAYAVAKAGVVKLTEVLAEEMKESDVRVNAIVPAVIDTPQNRQGMPAGLMRKAVAPEAIARVILFLCSEAAGIVTGAVVPVYGRY